MDHFLMLRCRLLRPLCILPSAISIDFGDEYAHARLGLTGDPQFLRLDGGDGRLSDPLGFISFCSGLSCLTLEDCQALPSAFVRYFGSLRLRGFGRLTLRGHRVIRSRLGVYPIVLRASVCTGSGADQSIRSVSP